MELGSILATKRFRFSINNFGLSGRLRMRFVLKSQDTRLIFSHFIPGYM